MKFVSVGLLLGVCLAFGGQPGATLAPVALYSQFEQEAPSAVVDAMRQEVASIMAPMGMHFNWHALSAARGSDVAVELAVLTFKGRCEVNRPIPAVRRGGALGWTHVSGGEILPFADIDCDGVGTFLQNGLLAMRAEKRPEALGRALGRVVAHELYHIFANTPHHGSGGVGKAAYTVQNLLADDFQFDEKESTALIGSKAFESLTLSSPDESK